MTPLGELIEDVRAAFLDRHGVQLSYADIARRGGDVVGRKRIQQLAQNEIKDMPRDATLRALAKGLEVPYSVVLEKALVSAGYTWPARERDTDRKIG